MLISKLYHIDMQNKTAESFALRSYHKTGSMQSLSLHMGCSCTAVHVLSNLKGRVTEPEVCVQGERDTQDQSMHIRQNDMSSRWKR